MSRADREWIYSIGMRNMVYYGEINIVLGRAINTPSAAKLLRSLTMPSIPATSFYVYILCRPSRGKQPHGKPFYVGKGQGRRIYEHDSEARSNCTCHKCNVIRKIWKSGGQIQRYIIFTTDNEAEAFAYEVETIALYGRKNLCNQADGGEGPSGVVVSEKERARRSAAAKARWENPEYRAMHTAAIKAASNLPERRQRASEIGKAYMKNNPEYRAKQSAKLKEYNANPDVRKRTGERSRAAFSSPEARRQMSERSSKSWADPDRRAKQSARVKEIWARRKAEKEHVED